MLRRIWAALGFGRERTDASESTGDGDSGDDASTEDAGTVWDFVPNWQYNGRHAESGGFTRDEQERALRDIERKAEIIEGDADRTDPGVDREK